MQQQSEHQQQQQQQQQQHHHYQQQQLHSMRDMSSFDQVRGDSMISVSSSQQQLMHGQAQRLGFAAHQQDEDHISQQPQHQVPRRNQTLSPSHSGEPRKISCQDIQQVQNLIERCLQLYMNQKEVINKLLSQAKIEPGFTGLVWQKLEEQNREFFRAYYTRLHVKQQIEKFNQLLEKQAAAMDKMAAANASAPISNGLHSSTVKHGHQNYSMQSQEISRLHTTDHSLLSSSSPLINGASLASMNVSGDNSLLREPMGISSSMPSTLPNYQGVAPKTELSIQPGLDFSNDSSFLFNGFRRPTDMPNNVIDAHIPNFPSNEPPLHSGVDSFLDSSTSGQRDAVGLIPRNFSLSDLTADFTQTTDILENYSGSPFLTPESFLRSPDNDDLDDNRILDSVSDAISYEGFTGD